MPLAGDRCGRGGSRLGCFAHRIDEGLTDAPGGVDVLCRLGQMLATGLQLGCQLAAPPAGIGGADVQSAANTYSKCFYPPLAKAQHGLCHANGV